MNEKIRLVIAEKRTLIRKSLYALLKEYSQVEIAADVGDSDELFNLLKSSTPEIVLLDLETQTQKNTGLLKRIQSRFPSIKVVILSEKNDLEYINNCIINGASGFVTKDCSPDFLVKTLLLVQQYGFYLDKEISQNIVQTFVFNKSVSFTKSDLSKQEVNILNLLFDGKTEKQIAGEMNISRHTVHFHRRNIYSKTKSHNLAELFKYFKNGLPANGTPGLYRY